MQSLFFLNKWFFDLHCSLLGRFVFDKVTGRLDVNVTAIVFHAGK